MNTTSQTRELRFLSAGTIIFLLILLFLTGLGYNNLTQKKSTFSWVNHTLDVINSLQETETIVQEISSNNRALVITEQDQYRSRLAELLPALDKKMEHLEFETRDNPTQQKNIGRLESTTDELKAYSLLALELIDQKRKDEVIEMVREGKGQKIIRRVNKIIAEMKNVENELLSQRIKEYEEAETVSSVVIFSASFFSFILLVSGFIYLRRQLLYRMRVQADLNKLAQIQKTILESAAFALIATDKDGAINLFNPAAEKLLGYKAE